jgi:GNAT superfamily N-acetyltransferase
MNATGRIHVYCRPARPEDKNDVLALTKTIWDGGDYVPYVWDDWLADRQGLLAVAEWQGRAVGLGKLTCIAPENWWLEGLRTDPQHEGRGIASQLFEHLVGTWQETGGGTLRLSTHYENYPIHHLCERHGFDFVDEYVPYRADLIQETPTVFQPVAPEELVLLLQALRHSPQMALLHGLVDLGWKWCGAEESLVMDILRDGRAWWWVKPGQEAAPGVLLISRDDDGPGTPVFANICGLSCPPASLHGFLLDFRHLVWKLGYSGPGWVLPNRPELREAAAAASFQRSWDGALRLYAKRHGSGSALGQ